MNAIGPAHLCFVGNIALLERSGPFRHHPVTSDGRIKEISRVWQKARGRSFYRKTLSIRFCERTLRSTFANDFIAFRDGCELNFNCFKFRECLTSVFFFLCRAQIETVGSRLQDGTLESWLRDEKLYIHGSYSSIRRWCSWLNRMYFVFQVTLDILSFYARSFAIGYSPKLFIIWLLFYTLYTMIGIFSFH